ncbi:MAG: TonB-dependent receptor [Bacteroidetes bacterium]|nr:TonB-dependent receptor [Bacteroidota bacterium]
MKIFTFFLLVCIIPATAGKAYSQDKKITLNERSISLDKLFQKIEEVSDYRFLYRTTGFTDLTQKVNINAQDEKLSSVLNTVLANVGINYTLVGTNLIVISPAPEQKQLKVTGKITDKSGQPLTGVTVSVKGTIKAVVTNENGIYSINLTSKENVLVFTFIGMKRQEIRVDGKPMINVVLEEESIGLNEVVVVGYGTESKAKLISSVATLKTKEIINTPYTDMGAALAGRIAGVIVQSQGGEPGTTPSISIRGGGDPLYVIDGIVKSNSDFIALSKDDIGSISVLKDAAATAVYGARAANGIILVTTKQGGYKEAFHITYKNSFAVNTLSQPIDYINSYNYARTANDIAQANGMGPFYAYSQKVMDTIKNNLNPSRYPNTNWFKTLMNKFAPQQDQSLLLSGGSDNTKYYVGVGYLNQGTEYKFDAYKFARYTYRSNVTSKFDNIGLEVSLNLNGNISNKKSPTEMPHKEAVHPLDQPYNKDGTISDLTDHPLADIGPGSGYQKGDTYVNDGSLTLNWTVPGIKGLKLKALGDYTTNNYSFDAFYTLAPQYDELGIQRVNSAPSKYQQYSRTLSYNFEGQVDYTHSFGKHNMNLTLVSTTSAGSNNWFDAGRKDFMSSAVDQLFAGSSGTMTNNGNASKWGRQGYVGRAKYDYNNKYIVELSGRYDGSDNFPVGKRWGFFPSVALGWTVSDENFFAVVKENKIFDNFKIRGSFGTVGNDNVSRYAYIPSYNMNSQVYVSGGQLLNGFSEGDLTSDNLSWYTTKSYDLGFDFATLNSHLTGSFDYFYSRTTGYLTSPASRYVDPLGKSLPLIKSSAAYRKAGYDGNISYNDKIGKVSYGVGFNMTYYNSLWEKSNEDSVSLLNPYTRSQGSLENYYSSMYTSLGFYQSYDQVMNNPRRIGSTSLAPGDIMYKDVNGDGKIDQQDFRKQGNSTSPHFVFGVTLNAEYKGFKFNALVQGTGKRDLYIGSLLQAQDGLGRYNYNYQTNYWTTSNTNAMFPRPIASSANSSNNYTSSNFWLINAQYVRLKSMSISYDLKKSVLSNLKWVDSFSLFVSGTNLLTFSPCKKYLDPEAWDSNNFGYPINSTYSIGVNVGF